MSNDIRSEHDSQAQELHDLRLRHRKEKEKLTSTLDQDIRETQDQFRRREQEVQQHGEAAINHIRTDRDNRIAALRLQAQAKLENEKTAGAKLYQNVHNTNLGKIKDLKEELNRQQEQYQSNLSNERTRYAELHRQEGQKTQEISSREQLRRQKIEKDTSKSIGEYQGRVSEERQKMQTQHREEMRKLSEDHQTQTRDLAIRYKATQDALAKQQHAQIASIQGEGNNRFERERVEKNQQLVNLRQQYDTILAEETKKNEQLLTETKEGARAQLFADIKKSTEQREKLRREYDVEVKRVHQAGEKAIGDQRVIFTDRIAKQEHEYEDQKKEIDVQYEKNKVAAIERHQQELAKMDTIFKGERKNQEEDFKQIKEAIAKNNEQTLQGQRDLFVRNINNQRIELMKKFGKYSDAKDDPFYAMKNFNPVLKETDTHFILEAKVPEGERKNVDVFVQKDKMVLSGQRSFTDKMDQETGHRLSTQNYQSFREEIPLSFPVVEKLVQKEFQGDNMIVKVPKIPTSKA